MDAMTAFAVGQAVTLALKKSHHTTRVIIGKDTRRLRLHARERSRIGSDLHGRRAVPGRRAADSRASPSSPRACAPTPARSSPPLTTPIRTTASSSSRARASSCLTSRKRSIEELILGGKLPEMVPPPHDMGRAYRLEDAAGRYIVFLKNTFPRTLSMEGLKIVLDTANGATYKVAPAAFTELGADVTVIHNTPDGLNINDELRLAAHRRPQEGRGGERRRHRPGLRRRRRPADRGGREGQRDHRRPDHDHLRQDAQGGRPAEERPAGLHHHEQHGPERGLQEVRFQEPRGQGRRSLRTRRHAAPRAACWAARNRAT